MTTSTTTTTAIISKKNYNISIFCLTQRIQICVHSHLALCVWHETNMGCKLNEVTHTHTHTHVHTWHNTFHGPVTLNQTNLSKAPIFAILQCIACSASLLSTTQCRLLSLSHQLVCVCSTTGFAWKWIFRTKRMPWLYLDICICCCC